MDSFFPFLRLHRYHRILVPRHHLGWIQLFVHRWRRCGYSILHRFICLIVRALGLLNLDFAELNTSRLFPQCRYHHCRINHFVYFRPCDKQRLLHDVSLRASFRMITAD
jgi:hypothetical protein